MKKMTKKIVPLLLMGVMLVSCGGNSKKPTCSVVLEPIPVSDNPDVVEKVEALSTTTLALKGHYYEKVVTNDSENMSVEYDFESVLTEDYYFCRYGNDSMDSEEIRVDRAADGRAKTVFLDPRTNIAVDYYYGDYSDEFYNYYLFESLFLNPFALAQSCFGLDEGKLSLIYPNGFSFVALINILTSGVGFLYADTFEYLLVEFDGTTPKKLEVCLSNRSQMASGQYTLNVYSGDFTTVDEITPVQVVKSRESQDGQKKLQDILKKIKKGNYTLSINETDGVSTTNYELRVTDNAYYVDYDGELKCGMYMTDGGLVEYKVNDLGVAEETKRPYSSRNIDSYFGFAYNYSARCFDVEEDGSFVLANEKDFYSLVLDFFLPDGVVTSVESVDKGSLKMVVDESANTLSYTYTSLAGSLQYDVVVSNIGTTALPFATNSVVKYVPLANWSEYCVATGTEKLGQILDLLSGGNKDDIPFVDLPYRFVGGYDGDTIGNTIIAVRRLELVFECETTSEMIQWSQDIYAQLDACPNFTLDKVTGVYTYETATAKFSFEVKISNGFMHAGEIFNHAIMITIVNLK